MTLLKFIIVGLIGLAAGYSIGHADVLHFYRDHSAVINIEHDALTPEEIMDLGHRQLWASCVAYNFYYPKFGDGNDPDQWVKACAAIQAHFDKLYFSQTEGTLND